jgi:hypothetical protein
VDNSNLRSGTRRAALIESLEQRLLMVAGSIVVNSQNYAPLQLYSQSGALLATSSNYPTESSPGAGDGGSAGALVVDQNDNLQVVTGVFQPFLQRYNGQLSGGGGWTTEQTSINVPGWSKVNRTFYGGLATIGNYVFSIDMSTGSGGGANGLIRFDASNNYTATRFANGTDYNEVTLGMDGNIYAMVSPGGEPEHGTVEVYDPNTLALIRSIPLTDYDDAAVVADAQGNIYTGGFDGVTNKISPAGVILASAPIASTDLQISTDGKILSCAGNTIRVLDENLNILSGFNVPSPVGAVFAAWNTYQAPGATTPTTTAVTSSNGSATFGQSVTLTATVTTLAGSGQTGTVQFMDGATPLGTPAAVNSSTGLATYTSSALSVASHTITAVYSGDGNYTASTSAAFAQNIGKATPNVSVSDAGGIYTGASFPATATVNGATKLETIAPTVAYYAGSTATGTPLGSAPSAAGTYTAVATFAGSADYAGATSSPVTFNITILPAAPSITTQPAGQTVLEGQAVSFTAAATGQPVPVVQWQFSSNGGATYSNIPGAIATTYILTALLSQTGYQYQAVFTNSQGNATTKAATLTVNSAPALPMIVTDPSDQMVPTGQLVTFTSSASGVPAPTVQWQSSSDGGASYANISGAKSASYSFTTAAAADGEQFRAVFTNTQGSATSATATLTLLAPLTAPTISTDPSDQTEPSGNAVTFTVAATGNPTPTIQWQSSADGTTFTDIAGATSATLSFTATSDQDGALYRAVLTNSQGSATSAAAMLTVTPTQFVEMTPPPGSVPAGQPFAFAANVMDDSGNVDPGFSGLATVALAPGSSATLGGELTVPVTNGVAAFSDLTIDSVGSYSLIVTSAAAAPGTTSAFAVTTPLSHVVPAITHESLPSSIIIGRKLRSAVSVVIRNTGSQQTGAFTVRLFADTTEALDGNEQLLSTITRNLRLRQNASSAFNLRITNVPSSLPAGTYHLIAQVVDPTGAIGASFTSNTFVAAAPFVSLTATPLAVTPATIAADRTGWIAVAVKNNGNVQAAGPITITLTPSADGISSMPVVLSSLSTTARIAANKSRTYRLHFKSTGQLASGTYFPWITVSFGGNDVTGVGSQEFTVG